jgi:hypothetical protein
VNAHLLCRTGPITLKAGLSASSAICTSGPTGDLNDIGITNFSRYVRNIISNPAGTQLNSDDVIRLFIDWLELYHEAHFAVVRHIYKNPGCTRFEIWDAIHGELPREDSAEADLFRLLIRDLGTGGVVRQERETNQYGQFIRKRPARRKGVSPATMESAFEETKPYVLSSLGQQFVHYSMNEVVPRIEAAE